MPTPNVTMPIYAPFLVEKLGVYSPSSFTIFDLSTLLDESALESVMLLLCSCEVPPREEAIFLFVTSCIKITPGFLVYPDPGLAAFPSDILPLGTWVSFVDWECLGGNFFWSLFTDPL